MRIFTLDNTFGYNPGRAAMAHGWHDRLAFVRRLDKLGIDSVEAGCAAAAGDVRQFFEHARAERGLGHTRLVASARLDAIHEPLERDEEVRAAIDSGAPVIALSACCWHAGSIGFAEYCRRIGEAVTFLKAHGLEVLFRDEDFFQSYAHDPGFALRTLASAKAAGADVLCLRDSTSSGMPQLVREASMEVRKRFEGVLGICAHDDSELALANTLEAVEQGFTHVEGSIEGYGRRGGLANLGTIISSLEQKLGHTMIGLHKLDEMAETARLVTPLALAQAARHEPDDETRPFVAERYELTSHSGAGGSAVTTATSTVRIGDSLRSETEDGDGAVNALERSLRQCLFASYPEIANVRVSGFRVTILEPARGTAANIRVTLEWTESSEHWLTDGVAADIIEATWLALVDGFRIALHSVRTADASWAV